MKKVFALFLALVMMIGLLPMTALADESVSATAQGVTVTIDKANYQQGEKIYYGWSGVDGRYEEISGVLWGTLVMCAAGSEHGDEIDYEYTDYESAEIDYDSSRWFTAPTTDGNYEMRFYWSSYFYEGEYFVLSIPFTVGNVTTVEPSPEPTEPQNVDLEVTVRDFKEDGILFESPVPYEKMTGMVSETLGADRKPVYNLQVWKDKYGDEVTQEMLTGLFNDVDGYNMSTKKTLTLEPRGSNWEITSSSMFPIDDELFGNEGNSHNYHFSIEIHSRFKYVQGAEFYFNGDDDIWVFFNNKLVIDLGGVSYSTSQTVKLDDIAADLGIKVGDIVSFDMFYMERHLTGSNMNMRTNFEFLNLDASAWALPELQRADDLGLIPDSLKSADLTQDITRAEFAAVSVKVYEALAGTAALPAVSNPFTDTSDVEILKAFNLGVTNGKYDNGTRFAPDEGLNRQEAATMLTRVFKRVTLPGWTLSTDSQFTLPYEKPEPFADDASIDAWAKDSVYFMAANGIINGIGGGKFAPKNVTTEDEATGYANATREQALLIAVRMVENLGK